MIQLRPLSSRISLLTLAILYKKTLASCCPTKQSLTKKDSFRGKGQLTWIDKLTGTSKTAIELFCYGHCAMNLMIKASNLDGH